MAVTEQTLLERIAADRIKYHISPVTLHKLPRWFSKRLTAIGLAGTHALDQAAGGGLRIFDHAGQTPDGALVGEPYIPLGNRKTEEKASRIASALGIRCAITGPLTSWWYPGETIRISFFEADDSTPITDLRAAAKAASRQGRSLFKR